MNIASLRITSRRLAGSLHQSASSAAAAFPSCRPFSCSFHNSTKTILFLLPQTPQQVITSQTRPLHLSAAFSAGHSKWQNIKHTKMAKDQAKSQLYNRLISRIKSAVSKQGGSDPHLNKDFADVLDMCRKANMPNTTIDKAVKRAVEKRYVEVKLEIIGPENSLLVIDAEVDNRNYFKNEVRKVLKKYVGFGFANEGRALSQFSEKGVVRVRNTAGTPLTEADQEAAEEVAIEADAEEVRQADDDETVLLFIGEPTSYTKVKAFIEANCADRYVVVENGVELLPYVRTELTEETFNTVAEALGQIGELEGVNRVYTNF